MIKKTKVTSIKIVGTKAKILVITKTLSEVISALKVFYSQK